MPDWLLILISSVSAILCSTLIFVCILIWLRKNRKANLSVQANNNAGSELRN